jgi:bacteriorhodopsin
MIYLSGVISLCIQAVVGIIDYLAINIEIESKDELLKDLLKVELFVQVIEFMFYVFLIFYFKKTSQNITPFRYLDWAVTTPLMLISLSAFLNHDGRTLRLSDFLTEHKDSIIKIVLLNASMLFFGIVGELGYLNKYISTGLGFIPFFLNFKHIKDTFLHSSDDIQKIFLFYWFVIVWGMYGVFAVMSYTIKNTGYNILDIFSKNVFGIFLAYIVWSKHQSLNSSQSEQIHL